MGMNGRREGGEGVNLSCRLLLEVGGEWDESGVKERKATFMWFLARTMMFRPDGVKWSLVTWRMGMNGRRRRESLSWRLLLEVGGEWERPPVVDCHLNKEYLYLSL